MFATVIVRTPDDPDFPAASNARASMVWAPLATLRESHENVYGAAVAVRANASSTRSSTRVTPMSSVALAFTATKPDTVAPAAGLVIATVGA